MRVVLALSFLAFSFQAVAYPVSYMFSGSTTKVFYQSSSGFGAANPNQSLTINGQPVINGSSIFAGSITFDSEVTQYSQPGPHPVDDAAREAYFAALRTISYTVSFEGYEFSPQKNSCCGLWNYSDSGFSTFDELPVANSPFLREQMYFDFAPGSGGHAATDYLLESNFLSGRFIFSDAAGCALDHGICAISGAIDTLTRVVAVPEPSSLALGIAGAIGLIVSHRRKLQS